MTQDTGILRDTLIRRMAHGEASVNDLPLLDHLLICQRRQYLMIGMSCGMGILAALTLMIHLLS